ncbi:MAG: gluconate 2-dehydrogenase subunit 3 family protein [Aquabacterium sp.]|uniref:gluconate 2-dehydrogenase subunit 3 family protein n=1 Tax=Aquabacterium sp. TaxID=1872578 RepID=UPI0025C620D7|nr:gluconate 2-dehydrogenase subunit 3 family protein [Aquabacterium sp.]MBI5925258.1 gluconate 2-dehydrogenase subunit 3 family protein [Aquabacterium sp.]
MTVRTFSTWPFLPSLPQLRRRWFVGALLAGGLLGWAARADAKVAVHRARVKVNGAGRVLMPLALKAFVDHLIPADELTPAASALKVPEVIWQQAQADAELGRLVEVVCRWMDQYGEGFAALLPQEREALVTWMSKAPWESPQRRFFHLVRDRAFTLYYTQPASWKGLPMQRPPQPLGHVLD